MSGRPVPDALPSDAEVSAVIPTTGRPTLRDAVRSALRQTVPTLPVVVVDDPDAVSTVRRRLDGLPHRLVRTSGRRGGSAARNLGVHVAETPWVGFLDDDDAWTAEKASLQTRAAADDEAARTAVSSRALLVGEHTRVVPEQLYRSRTDDVGRVVPGVGDYVLSRSSLRLRRRFMQTSTLLCPREAAMAVPWREDLPRHQDWDWLIRWEHAGLGLRMLPEVLVRVRQDSPGSVSRSADWQSSAAWLKSVPVELAAESRADFLASVVARGAFAAGQWRPGMVALARGVRGRAHGAALVVGLSGLASGGGRRGRA